ncbi:restriction endonuclease subunit S domain-containing protein [Acetobacter okinawensis]|uniref:hypothetical protein n=1 Tax=Acetobacter okinawensis TaxID=1076594 RepID=UPI00046FA9BC|nr:hypothetical protein [Acetobacter okinawensis]
MALITIKPRFDIGPMFVLAPERYDPRRDSLKNGTNVKTVVLGNIASSVRQTISPLRRDIGKNRYVVLDTSDVREGIVIGKKQPLELSALGSAKKRLQPNDVLISRLRPYLRQVAFVDNDLISENGADLLCSTEFFILRPKTEESIAFLVPFLLSAPVQKVLSASQEGGHHPRFGEDVLLTLPIPDQLLDTRVDTSNEVIQGVAAYRRSERTLTQLIEVAESAMKVTKVII